LVDHYFGIPVVRLVFRAVVVGVEAAIAILYVADKPFSTAVLTAAGMAAILAAVEVFTPANMLVGLFKRPQ